MFDKNKNQHIRIDLRLIGSTSYNEDGDIIYTSKYDKHKKVTEVYNEKGDIISTSKYDSDENQTDLILYNQGEAELHYKYKYDNDGNEIEASFYRDGKILHKESFKYDNNGNQISSRYYSDGKLEDKYNDEIEQFLLSYSSDIKELIDKEIRNIRKRKKNKRCKEEIKRIQSIGDDE